MHTDVTALQQDHLTGLANRALFESQARYALDTARQNPSAIGVVLIDLDGFKPINDQFGHAAGDKVLVEIAQRLSSAAANDSELVARLGGDKFGIVTWLGCDEVALAGWRGIYSWRSNDLISSAGQIAISLQASALLSIPPTAKRSRSCLIPRTAGCTA